MEEEKEEEKKGIQLPEDKGCQRVQIYCATSEQHRNYRSTYMGVVVPGEGGAAPASPPVDDAHYR